MYNRHFSPLIRTNLRTLLSACANLLEVGKWRKATNSMQKVSTSRVFDRRKVATKDIPAPVVIEVRMGGRKRYLDTGVRLTSDQWNPTTRMAQRVQGTSKINQAIALAEARVFDVLEDLEERGKGKYTLDDIMQSAKSETCSMELFTDFLLQRIEERPMSDATRRQHKVIIGAVIQSDLLSRFSDLTPLNLSKFDAWLRKERGLTHQVTIANYHKRLKIYVREAMTYGHISKNPYDGFKVHRGESKGRKFLNKEELSAIQHTELHDEVMIRTRDLFVFQSYTGLAYADLSRFDFSKVEDRGGMMYLRDQRKKTNTEYFVYLLPPAVEVLRKYAYKLPIVCAQQYNMRLKALSAICGLKRVLSSHVARHTFATTITLSQGVPMHVLQKMMGHTNIKTTQIYAKVLAEDVEREFSRLSSLYPR